MRLIDVDELKKKAIIHFYTTNYFRHIMDMIDEAPTIEIEKTADMLVDEDGNIECSNCGSPECWGNFCMNCGAKMTERKANEDSN